jgi:hypothetical protein
MVYWAGRLVKMALLPRMTRKMTQFNALLSSRELFAKWLGLGPLHMGLAANGTPPPVTIRLEKART